MCDGGSDELTIEDLVWNMDPFGTTTTEEEESVGDDGGKDGGEMVMLLCRIRALLDYLRVVRNLKIGVADLQNRNTSPDIAGLTRLKRGEGGFLKVKILFTQVQTRKNPKVLT